MVDEEDGESRGRGLLLAVWKEKKEKRGARWAESMYLYFSAAGSPELGHLAIYTPHRVLVGEHNKVGLASLQDITKGLPGIDRL
jgi:hypothetical protein